MRQLARVLVIFILICMLHVGAEAFDKNSILLSNVQVFDVITGKMSKGQDILIGGDRIKKMGEMDVIPRDTIKIDCSGKYAVPGLCDSHTHIAFLTTLGENQPNKGLEDFVCKGITFVRDVGGPYEVLKKMKEQISRGKIMGPEIFFTGPMLEKAPLHWELHNKILPGFTVAMNTREDVDSLIPKLVESGACMVKTFNKMDVEIFKYIVTVADKNSLKVVHDPGSPLFHMIPMDKAIDFGAASIEHGKAPWPVVLTDELQKEHDKLLKENAEEVKKKAFSAKVFEAGIKSVSKKKLQRLIEKMLQNNTFFCPTLQVFEQMMNQLPPEGVSKEEHAKRIESLNGMLEVGNFFTEEIFRNGVKILVGQDGILPAGTFAEMRILKERGFPESEIIKGATINPAVWLGVADRLGSVSPGKQADIVILNKNPLVDINNIESTFLVIVNGKVLSQEDE